MNSFHQSKGYATTCIYIAACALFIDALVIYFLHRSNYNASNSARNILDSIIIISTILCCSYMMALVKEPLAPVDSQLFHEFPVAMYVFNSETFKLLAANAAALQQYGYAKGDFVRLKSSDLVLAGKVKRYSNSLEDNPGFCMDMGQWAHQNKDGEPFDVQVFERFTHFKGKPAKLVFAIPIEQLMCAELSFKKEPHELANILDYISEAFYTVDMDWHFTYVNKEYERIQHRDRTELLGKNVWELFPYGKELCFYQQYQRAVRDRVNVHFEEYNPYNRMWVLARAYPTNTGLAIYFKDITAEKMGA